ncbi:MAG: RNHCP domain-containing protein [Mycobacteriales bacterium]
MTAAPRFQRRVEDFRCGNCGEPVAGSGFTNHCPSCLWSRHVDIDPGDRAADCGALMAPLSATYQRGRYVLLHHCQGCGARKPNKAAAADDREMLIALTAVPFEL